jgi:hypothetical protein
MIVPHRLTPIPLCDLPGLLFAGQHQLLGYCLGYDTLATAWAHVCLEHGRDGAWLRAVWRHNLGNIDATAEERADPTIAVFRTVKECEGPTCSIRAVHWRRAFDTPEDGAAYYWERLRDRWPDAFYAMGDPAEFVKQLKAGRYFTGDVTAYTRAVVALAKQAPPLFEN